MHKKLTPEDAFYDTLTLGLLRTLANVPRICDVTLEKRQPCEKAQVINWEQRHCVYLPEDMKKFYLSTDGFILHWSYQYAPNDIRRVGNIRYPHLLQITMLRENVELTILPPANQANMPTPTLPKDIWGNPLPIITAKTKIFELNTVTDVAKVCMIYDNIGSNHPKFYLYELQTNKWVFLSDTFSEYLRMSIAHLGLPYWELCFTSMGLPTWTEQLFLLLAPHLLEDQELRRNKYVNPQSEHPYNNIDSNVFKAKAKSSNKSANISKHIIKKSKE